MRVSLFAPTGELIAGVPPAFGSGTVRAVSSDTILPWTVVVASPGTGSADAELSGRRRLLAAGLAAILALLAGGSYFLWRVIHRELAVQRLQADFVSTVSHEFRTPLTSLRHVAELLVEQDDMPAGRRRMFYAAIGRNAERLHRLVESLLDFGRMESGRQPYDLQPISIAGLVTRVVADFQRDVDVTGVTIDVDIDPNLPPDVRADPSALVSALWNLLDNAVKYSTHRKTVRVSVSARRGSVAIAIRDYGLGIPADERSEIFGRFVRGRTAARLGISGTGLGLAMVSHVVAAHGGAIELDSQEGIGSTFTIVLPVIAGAGLSRPTGSDLSLEAPQTRLNADAKG
jgi:signal transduction histidine kinase